MQIKGTYKEIWQIAFPIILGSLANSINQLIDTAFLGHYSEISLDAVTLTGIFFFNVTFIAGGFARGCQVIIARHNGEMQYQKIGMAFDHLLAFALLLSAGMMLFFSLATPAIVEISVRSEAIRREAIQYIHYLNYGVPAVVLSLCFNAFYSGIGKTRIISVATVCMAVTNIIFGYILIFGRFGVPASGTKGAAIATTIANYMLFLVYLIYFIRQQYGKVYTAFRFRVLQWVQFQNIIQLSTPIVLQNLIGITSWQYFFLCVEKLGEHELAVSGILKSVFIFLGIPVWSLASACNTVISNIIGQQRIDSVIPALKKIVFMTMGISFALNMLIVLFPHQVLSLFTSDDQMIRDCIPPFYTLMIALLFFSSAMIMNQGIIGTGATKIPAIVELLCAVNYIGYCFYFVQLKHSPLYIAWGCELVYWLSLLSFTLYYWGSGNWKKYIRRLDAEYN